MNNLSEVTTGTHVQSTWSWYHNGTCVSGDLEYRYVAVDGRRAAEFEERRSVPPRSLLREHWFWYYCYCCINFTLFCSFTSTSFIWPRNKLKLLETSVLHNRKCRHGATGRIRTYAGRAQLISNQNTMKYKCTRSLVRRSSFPYT